MDDLTSKKCVPCESWVPPMAPEKVMEMLQKVKDWETEENLKIKKKFEFKDFKEAMEFVNKVANLAEEEEHHPNIFIAYNKVTITLTTHFIKGLHENDFILAAKINKLTSHKEPIS